MLDWFHSKKCYDLYLDACEFADKLNEYVDAGCIIFDEYNNIVNGADAGTFPKVVVDYGYRDSTMFWYSRFKRPIGEKIPEGKGTDVDAIMYAADRIDPDIKFTKEACETIVKVPRVFLKTVLNSCVAWARENDVTLITEEHMKIINDKRSKEKK